MRKATLVLATSVAFLLFGSGYSHAGIKKFIKSPSSQAVATGAGLPVKSGNSLSIPGALQGEFIPGEFGTKGTPIKVLPTLDYSIPRIINGVKGSIRNPGSIVVGGVISTMLFGLDWVMDPANNSIQKKEVTVDGSAVAGTSGGNPAHICSELPASQTLNKITVYNYNGTKFAVTVRPSGQLPAEYNHYGNNCTQAHLGYMYNAQGYWPVSGARVISSADVNETFTPVTDADMSLVDAFVNAQNSQWLKDLLKESCEGSLNPSGCFESLKDNVSLSGPSTVSGPSSITTTTGPAGTKTKETTTNFQITYGSDYFIYTPITTTTTVNPDGTTEVETEEPAPEEEPKEEELSSAIEDPYAPVLDKYGQIADGVGDLDGSMSFISYAPWYSFGGNCSPITLDLPVMGSYTIDHCPYVIDWIRPTLGFLFAVWTWLHCFALWRETVQNARPI